MRSVEVDGRADRDAVRAVGMWWKFRPPYCRSACRCAWADDRAHCSDAHDLPDGRTHFDLNPLYYREPFDGRSHAHSPRPSPCWRRFEWALGAVRPAIFVVAFWAIWLWPVLGVCVCCFLFSFERKFKQTKRTKRENIKLDKKIEFY